MAAFCCCVHSSFGGLTLPSVSPSLCFEKKAFLITWILGWVSITSVGLGFRFSEGKGRMLYSYWAHTEGESDAGRLFCSREGETRPCRRKNQLSI